MKHCWQKTETIARSSKTSKGMYVYKCKQCGVSFVCSNPGKITSKDWKDPKSYLIGSETHIYDDCAEQVVKQVSEV